jgi:tRNA 2-thiocytidine biosynthesis protein TtcA
METTSQQQALRRKALRKITLKTGKTIEQLELLKDGDKILIALSGGKDSYALLEILAETIRIIPAKIELIAAHVAFDNVGYRINKDYMRNLCKELKIPFFLLEEDLEINEESTKSMCFACSWNRRKLLFKLAKDHNCNKMALGHHMDDAVQTLLMNLIWHGSVSSLPFKLKMFDGRMDLIRPLLNLTEEEIVKYVRLRDYPESIICCPYDSTTRRQSVRELIAQIKNLTPNALTNMHRSMSNIYFEYLPDSNKPTYHEQFRCF